MRALFCAVGRNVIQYLHSSSGELEGKNKTSAYGAMIKIQKG